MYLVTDEVLAKAIEYQAKVMARKKYNINCYELDEPDRFRNGYLGEWGFEQFLIENEIPYKHVYRDDGYPDCGDFLIFGERYDVKTASKDHYIMLMLPYSQFTIRSDVDYYVGAKLLNDGKRVEILGLCERSDMKFKMYKVLTAYRELSLLNPVQIIVDKKPKA